MLKVFIAEDESVVREGLRDNIPWQQFGFEFAGEAADGEMALQQIRKIMPDLLITDIKMPFMDGLSLCHIVHREFPEMKVIIISGYDDFEYARRALHEGVDQYLSKPVTRRSMQNALTEIRKKIDAQRKQQDYLEQFQMERQEYEQIYRRAFFEKVFSGNMSVEEIYEQAMKLSIDIEGPCYNLIFFSLAPCTGQKKDAEESPEYTLCREKIIHYFLRFPQYLFFRWSIQTYGVLVKGEERAVKEYTSSAVSHIQKTCSGFPDQIEWYVGCGEGVSRFSLLKECYTKVNHIFSYRFLAPREHLLTGEIAVSLMKAEEAGRIEEMDVNKLDPEIIRGFLRRGQPGEVPEFTAGYLEGLTDPLRSRMFRDYFLLNLYFTVVSYLGEIGAGRKETDEIGAGAHSLGAGTEAVRGYMEALLYAALKERDEKEGVQGSRILTEALAYIDEHYRDEQLSLNMAASSAGVSTNYFSALFSQKTSQTFVEYVTRKRMEKAKELLREKKLHTAEIAQSVGYRDPHYFSFVFKRTTGMTPREFRSREE